MMKLKLKLKTNTPIKRKGGNVKTHVNKNKTTSHTQNTRPTCTHFLYSFDGSV
jgi:hypothetical protein